jgi:hypothetical protein
MCKIYKETRIKYLVAHTEPRTKVDCKDGTIGASGSTEAAEPNKYKAAIERIKSIINKLLPYKKDVNYGTTFEYLLSRAPTASNTSINESSVLPKNPIV